MHGIAKFGIVLDSIDNIYNVYGGFDASHCEIWDGIVLDSRLSVEFCCHIDVYSVRFQVGEPSGALKYTTQNHDHESCTCKGCYGRNCACWRDVMAGIGLVRGM
eukprot:1104062-Amorphochlora_amoeboformis.AAC.1